VGAAIGGLGGLGIGANVDITNDSQDDKKNAAIGTAAGAALGAIAGYAICAAMPEAAPPPPVSAPPPPVVKREPVIKKTVVLPGVNFAFNRADLLPAAKEILDREVVPELKENAGENVRVEGHTDSVGTDSYNQQLSEKRANSVRDYLVSQGISSSRIETRGYGESQPVADNESAIGRAKNRRVEIKIME
jgi:OOP family OmpA-OmpF porin